MEQAAKAFVETYPNVIVLLKAAGPPSVALIAAMIALSAALIASGIQYFQWRTASEKLRFDVFDKRIKVYEKLYQGFLEFQAETNVSQDRLRELHFAVAQVAFLFPSDVSTRVASAYKTLERLREKNSGWLHEERKAQPDQAKLEAYAVEMQPLHREIDNTLEAFPELFNSFLYFGDIKRRNENRLVQRLRGALGRVTGSRTAP